jgi:hypothetical protein
MGRIRHSVWKNPPGKGRESADSKKKIRQLRFEKSARAGRLILGRHLLQCGLENPAEMEFPVTWVVFQAEDFATTEVRAPGSTGMEVMAQMRPNGRLLDHFRVVLGGSEILEAAMPLDRLIPSPNLNRWRARYQFWARDTAIRRNMTTSSWRDVYQLIHSNEFRIENEEGELVDTADVRVLDEENKSAVIRYATTIGEDRRMTLELQSLPTSLAAVNSKPTFRG